ncbi:MAG: hypothetical protein A2855_00520 [Candidatus Liptonbacteria bacterium RIFCSPHIGHO2_01_FULL_57_28]|uniref:HAD family hydrolase n=1 Tax=Candidatus Liptonbacteria bacterium RIFCSPHIGHO2_01_FULL_57_28 TaxID=1798647 RepID=A0A1G2CDH3_9BACT|nr:MAG: hypothetical protein A2855_00520 [Candidatus Liptonbacteria bacterium RIFCSPHIGHO2_01_FULL_57_28]
MKIILDYNRTIFDPESEKFYPGVSDMLQRIAASHELFLISTNKPGRERTLVDAGIRDFFKKTVFTGSKTPELFLELAGEDKDVLVVGDRIRKELRIGNMLGLVTVWVRQGKFAAETPASQEEIPTHSIQSIDELEDIISAYEK